MTCLRNLYLVGNPFFSTPFYYLSNDPQKLVRFSGIDAQSQTARGDKSGKFQNWHTSAENSLFLFRCAFAPKIF